jgi:hypothetical protein
VSGIPAKRVIFLDIDGVLNCRTTPNPRKFPYVIDPRLLARLNALLDQTKADVVLSSTWRLDPAGIFSAKHWGVPFIDICPDMPDKPRRAEALAWLARHPGVHRFAVIDDEDDELDGLPLFQPSSRTGITDQIVEGVAAYLNGRTDQTIRANRFIRLCQNVHSLLKRDKS